MAEIKNSESDMSTQQKAELDKEKRREERGQRGMKQVEVRKQLAKARAGLYRFLGGLYIMEVDAETLANMKQMQFPTDCENPELAVYKSPESD